MQDVINTGWFFLCNRFEFFKIKFKIYMGVKYLKAAVFKGIKNIEIKDVPKPKINEEEVLIKVKYCSICGTDKKIYYKGRSTLDEKSEQILGHEITGVIEEIGGKVKHYKKGMRVNLAPNLGCGFCELCRSGLEQLCPHFKAFGVGLPGGFAQYIKVPEEAIKRGHLVELPDHVGFKEAALIEPLSCCFNGRQALGIEPGESLLIFGAGPMGNLHLLLNQQLGIGKIIVVDVDEKRLEFSKKYGADYIINGKSDMIDKVMKITNGKGVENIITTAPVPEVQRQALRLVAINGKINFFAGIAGEAEIKINPNKLHYEQIKLTGTTGSSLQQFRQTVKILQNNKLNIKQMVTKVISIDRLETIFEEKSVLRSNMKIIVEPNN